jgi:6-phosphofructokinase 1
VVLQTGYKEAVVVMSNDSTSKRKSFGIVVSGGPAPGINSVISSSVIEAVNRGYQIKGLVNGFRDITVGEPNSVIPLTTEIASTIYNKGGSIIGTSRFNPFKDTQHQEAFLAALAQHDIDKLIVIGGEGSAFLSLNLARKCPDLAVVHVPKTIDNDLILPNKYPSFGFETALHAGTKIVEVLREDAKTCKRWYITTTMGRKAGFLALGIGLSAGGTSTLIPEEFAGYRPTPHDVASIIFSTMRKRIAMKKNYGVIVLAEGILDCIQPDESDVLRECVRDDLGRIRYSQVELGDVVIPHLKSMLKDAGLDSHMVRKNIGYELRCCDPISFDIEYTRFLGYGAVQHILGGHSGIMVTRDFDKLGFIPLESMVGEDGLIRSRGVDLSSDLYRVARSFMIR